MKDVSYTHLNTGCCGKVAIATYGIAKTASKRHEGTRNAYKCMICGLFHVGSTTKRPKQDKNKQLSKIREQEAYRR
jgi:hypothetical protein